MLSCLILIPLFGTLIILIFYIGRDKINKQKKTLEANKTKGGRILAPVKVHNIMPRRYIYLSSSTGGLAMVGMAVSTQTVSSGSLIGAITLGSAFLFGVGSYLDFFSSHIPCLFIPFVRDIMEQIIQHTEYMSRKVTELLSSGDLDIEYVRKVHQYLTPYIRSYETLFHFFNCKIYMYLERTCSHHLENIEDVLERYRDAGNKLLELYRDIEEILCIHRGDSPIPIQPCED